MYDNEDDEDDNDDSAGDEDDDTEKINTDLMMTSLPPWLRHSAWAALNSRVSRKWNW